MWDKKEFMFYSEGRWERLYGDELWQKIQTLKFIPKKSKDSLYEFLAKSEFGEVYASVFSGMHFVEVKRV